MTSWRALEGFPDLRSSVAGSTVCNPLHCLAIVAAACPFILLVPPDDRLAIQGCQKQRHRNWRFSPKQISPSQTIPLVPTRLDPRRGEIIHHVARRRYESGLRLASQLTLELKRQASHEIALDPLCKTVARNQGAHDRS